MPWLNNARILAIFAVVFLHVASDTVLNEPVGTANWWVANFYDSLVRWCVPVFVMISGALLLDPSKKETLGEFYVKRLSRVLLPLIAWTIFYCFWTYLNTTIRGGSIGIESLVTKILTGRPYYHMWFLFMLVSMYFFTPFFRKVVSGSSPSEIALMAFVSLLIALVNAAPIASRGSGHGIFLIWFLEYIPYFFLGYVIRFGSRKYRAMVFLALFCAATVLTATGCYLVAKDKGLDAGLYFYGYLSITVVPMSISAMYLLKGWGAPIWSNEFTEKVASLTLGVYLIHPAFLDAVNYKIKPLIYNIQILTIPIFSVLIFLASLLAAWAISKTPYIRRLI